MSAGITTFPLAPKAVFALGRLGPEGLHLLGTAFAVSGTKMATSAHVTGSDDANLVLVHPRIEGFGEYQDTADPDVRMSPVTIVAIDPVRDLALVEVDGSLPVTLALAGTDQVLPGSPVATLGFPHADHGRLVLTQQDTHVGALVLIESNGVKSKHIILNTQARPGQSGGPVFDAQSGEVVAVLIGSYAPGGGGGISLGGVDPHSLHQTTHAISAEYISKMM
jgi:S1-C subfamily serine protease